MNGSPVIPSRRSPRGEVPVNRRRRTKKISWSRSPLCTAAGSTSGTQPVSPGSIAATLDRLLARLRLVVRGADQSAKRVPTQTSDAEEEADAETQADRRRRAKLASAFERLVEVLVERVAADPAPELKRLGELGVHVLQRHVEDAERIVGFLRKWTHMACDHLRLSGDDDELRKLVVALVALGGVYDNDPRRGRRQLLDIAGQNFQIEYLVLDPADPDLRSVVALVSATVGVDAWLTMLDRMAEVRVGLDDVREILSALGSGRELAELPTFEQTEELAQLKRLIAKGKLNSIYQEPRTTTACPACNRRLPVAQLEQFRQRGLVRNECCNGVMVRSDA